MEQNLELNFFRGADLNPNPLVWQSCLLTSVHHQAP